MLGGVDDELLKESCLVAKHRSAPLPPTGTLGRRQWQQLATIAAWCRAAHGTHAHGRARLGGQECRTGGNLGRGAEQLDFDTSAGDVAIGDEPDRFVAPESGYQLGRVE